MAKFNDMYAILNYLARGWIVVEKIDAFPGKEFYIFGGGRNVYGVNAALFRHLQRYIAVTCFEENKLFKQWRINDEGRYMLQTYMDESQ